MQSIINLSDYPIHQPDSNAYQNMVNAARDTLHGQDALELPDFLLPDTVRKLVEFSEADKNERHFMQGLFPAYSDNMNDRDDTELPMDHPSRIRLTASHHFIAGDQIDHKSPLRLLYNNQSFIEFLKQILGTPTLHTVADNLGCMNLLVYKPGDCNGWHFDTTEFIVSLILQIAEKGGEYQYIPNLRSATNENLSEVSKRMQNPDNPAGIQKANLQPGSLFLFRGKNTLHRVTKITGQQDRIVGILSYHQKPGHLLTKSSRMAMYGRIY